MKLCLIAALGMTLSACSSCTPAPYPVDAAPQPAPSPTNDPTSMVLSELVDAGCLAADPNSDGYAALYELSISDQEPAWLSCMFSGLSVKQCGAPCDTDNPAD